MAQAVDSGPDPVALALTEAVKPGDEFVPATLLAVINADPNPTCTLDEMDRGNAHYEAIQQDLAFLHMRRVRRTSPAAEDQARLTALMRWVIREFGDWREAHDPKGHRLAALFIITAYCSHNGEFWPAFVSSGKANPELIDELGKRLSRLRSVPAMSGRSRTPISDSEIIGRFNTADAAKDWETIALLWPQLGDYLFSDVFISQSARYLQEFARDTLRLASNQIQQTLPVMLLLLSLTVEESLSLAIVSANPYVHFGSILRLFQQQRRRGEAISQNEEKILTQLLLMTASNFPLWEQWMPALNRFPERYQQMQTCLGHALAQTPDGKALMPYIDAVNLTTLGSGSREVVADCLRAFRSAAPLARRQELWTLAHERWSRWNYAAGEPNQTLATIGCCELDYAVVGYAIECMSPQERGEKYAALTADLLSLPTTWHASVTDCIRATNRILSCIQPFAYAEKIGPNDDWLMKMKYMLPFDPKTDRYKSLLYKQPTLMGS